MQPTETNAANLFVPDYMPEHTIYTTAVGILEWLASFPKCLSFEDEDGLKMALAALGYPYTAAFDYAPLPTGQPFGGGPKNGLVPWIKLSPVPVTNDQWLFFFTREGVWVQGWEENGAFAMTAGQLAAFFSHGVEPFVGSSYEADLRKEISNRIEAAKAGTPVLG